MAAAAFRSGGAGSGWLGGCGACFAFGRRVQRQDHTALGDLVADLELNLFDRAGPGRRDVHGGLVGLQRNQRILGFDRIAGLNVDLDDRHVLEIADVRYFDVFHTHGSVPLQQQPADVAQ